MNVRVLHDWLHGGRLVLLLLAALFIRPPAAGAYPCFYEMNAPTRQSSGQSLLAGHVDAATGAFNFRLGCNAVSNPGLGLSAAIIYNTQDSSLGPCGPGTATPYDWFITTSVAWPGSPYVLVGPGNHQYVFDTNNSGVYSDTRDPFMLGATLTFSGNAVVTWKNGLQ
jgi:hypothetical protein